jgi:secreted trypsin-like serine protease
MGAYAKTAGIRAGAFAGACLLLLVLFQFSPPAAGAETAHTSIVNGKTTSIKDWPWQVAIAVNRHHDPRDEPRARFFCGGSLIAPDLVLTAGHCVYDLSKRQVGQIEVISGRTRLNDESKGQVTGVANRMMPVSSHGKRRFTLRNGVGNWDFALLRLSKSLGARTIKIAGPDELDTWSPGRIVKTTGWGVTEPSIEKASPVLRVASQVMLDEKVCAKLNGDQFQSRTMNCMGGPSTNTSTCFGDSGGPLVAPIEGGYRLMGVTSFGDAECSPDLPSIDTRIASDPMRDWIQKTALRVSGIDVVGQGGVAPPKRVWCRVPELTGLTVPLARTLLAERGCRLGQINRYGRGSRITDTSMIAGWFTPPGRPIGVWVGL